MNNFKERLKILRKEVNFTQTKLANKLNYSRSTIAQYERGIRTPSINFLIEVANFFEVSLDYLMGRSNIRMNFKNEEDVSLIKTISKMHGKKYYYKNYFSQNVADLSFEIGKQLSLSTENLQLLYISALLHDVGELYLPSEIINRPAELTKTEFKLIESHPKISYEILEDVNFDKKIKNIILQHHERLDGTGYPKGLTADKILKEAKIIAVADSIIAMISKRPYRKAYIKEQALKKIINNKNIQYDPEIVDICVELFENNIFSIIKD